MTVAEAKVAQDRLFEVRAGPEAMALQDVLDPAIEPFDRAGRLGRFTPEHVAQKWEPVLRFSNMRDQGVRAGRVTANERDAL